jgi:hypothetical protein
MPKTEQMVQMMSRKISARWKNCRTKGLSLLMRSASFPEKMQNGC